MKSYARENQDLFILKVLGEKKKGTYLEIGASHPIIGSNTYLLESQFEWSGLSIEWNVELANTFNIIRRTPCLVLDGTKQDYSSLLQICQLPSKLDFLQLDIDPPQNTLKALKCIDLNKLSFSVITYEHDHYAGGEKERAESREILKAHGYTRVLSDVMHGGAAFEDWYVNEAHMETDDWKLFEGERIPMDSKNIPQKYADILKTLEK
jgi:hypothetical protein